MGFALTATQKQLLLAIWKANNYSTNARSKETTIIKFLPSNIKSNHMIRKNLKKDYRKLRSLGLILLAPSGENTYKVTKDGQEYITKKLSKN